ncbi:hypothetical protein HMPREF9412_4663 [Paenibacillus sp. HGF5]|nr:hypothetical protein HMPREF9412_4663 [Paenibacillus sp. HGF5]
MGDVFIRMWRDGVPWIRRGTCPLPQERNHPTAGGIGFEKLVKE